MKMYALLLAAEDVVEPGQFSGHMGNLIFMGCFFIAVLLGVIWWLKR